jgi:hypothetical protein
MADMREREQLEALRQRLYERGQDKNFVSVRHELSTTAPADVARGWVGMTATPVRTSATIVTPVMRAGELVATEPETAALASDADQPKRRRYRAIILLSTLVLFIMLMGASSLYLFFGGNQISGRNIAFVISGPNTVAGGDVLQFQVDVTNNNVVAIEGATLIINYPPGTKSVEDTPRDLFEERIPLETIAAGESRTIPLQAVVFGEENQAKEVKVSIDYRVTGSNGTFFKEADPLAFTVNSSPLSLRVESVEKVSSGQEFEMKLIVTSNAQTPLSDVLITATYPDSFRFIRAKPEPSFRDNQWLLKAVTNQDPQEIIVRGTATGLSNDAFIVRFQAGTPRSDNQFMVGSVLAQSATTFTIEQPFVAMEISVNADTDADVVLMAGSVTDVTVTVTNTHSEPVYDMSMRVSPKGTGFRESLLRVTDGFYDSVNKEIRWEVAGMSSLSKVLPGERREFRFQLNSDTELSTAALTVDASVFARRVNEANVPEELIGQAETIVRYASVPTVGRQIDRLTGPVPPVANQETLYTITLEAAGGANDLSGATLVTSLPQYVRWLDAYEGTGQVSYNPVNRELRWNIGEIKARARTILAFQVGITPSVLQVGSTPVMMNRQELTATDRFTGTPLRADAAPITTELSPESGFDQYNGVVVATP